MWRLRSLQRSHRRMGVNQRRGGSCCWKHDIRRMWRHMNSFGHAVALLTGIIMCNLIRLWSYCTTLSQTTQTWSLTLSWFDSSSQMFNFALRWNRSGWIKAVLLKIFQWMEDKIPVKHLRTKGYFCLNILKNSCLFSDHSISKIQINYKQITSEILNEILWKTDQMVQIWLICYFECCTCFIVSCISVKRSRWASQNLKD